MAQAELLFKRGLTVKIVSITGVDEAIAAWYLEKTNYDVPAALKGIDDEFLTLAKRILRRYGTDMESGLRAIVNGVEQVHDMTRPFSWLEKEEINQLAPEVSRVVMVMEWLAYAEHEGLDSAMHFYLEDVIAHMRGLLLEDLAQTLVELKTVYSNLNLLERDRFSLMAALNSSP